MPGRRGSGTSVCCPSHTPAAWGGDFPGPVAPFEWCRAEPVLHKARRFGGIPRVRSGRTIIHACLQKRTRTCRKFPAGGGESGLWVARSMDICRIYRPVFPRRRRKGWHISSGLASQVFQVFQMFDDHFLKPKLMVKQIQGAAGSNPGAQVEVDPFLQVHEMLLNQFALLAD